MKQVKVALTVIYACTGVLWLGALRGVQSMNGVQKWHRQFDCVSNWNSALDTRMPF